MPCPPEPPPLAPAPSTQWGINHDALGSRVPPGNDRASPGTVRGHLLRALDISRSNPGLRALRVGLLSRLLATEAWNAGTWDAPTYARLLEARDEALRANPDRLEPPEHVIKAAEAGAEYAVQHGGDPTPFWREVRQTCEAALKVDPGHPDSLMALASTAWQEGKRQITLGQDPLPSLRKARSLAEEALRRRATVAEHLTLGMMLLELGNAESSLGLKGLANTEAAVAAFKRTTEMAPLETEHWVNLAMALEQLEAARADGHTEGRPGLDRAEAALAQALQLEPNNFYAHRTAATIALHRAHLALASGGDPFPHLEHLRNAGNKALASMQGGDPNLWLALAEGWVLTAKVRGQSHPGFREAVEEAQKAARALEGFHLYPKHVKKFRRALRELSTPKK